MKRLVPSLLAGIVIAGCSSTVQVSHITATAPHDPLPITVALYIPDEVKQRTIHTTGNDVCGINTFDTPIGTAVADAVESGLAASTRTVHVVDHEPQGAMMRESGTAYLVKPRIVAATVHLTFERATVTEQIHAETQLTVAVSLTDPDGKAWSFNVSGIGTGDGAGRCADGTITIQQATEAALQQVADHIAEQVQKGM